MCEHQMNDWCTLRHHMVST